MPTDSTGAKTPGSSNNAQGWASLGMQAAGPALGQIYSSIFHKSQVRQQQDFQDQQIAGQKELAEFNEKLGLQTARDEMENLKTMGLNPGLMYKQGGNGGFTQVQSGNVTGGQAPKSTEVIGMGMQMGAQLALIKAQTDNINAQTRKLESEVPVNEANVPKIKTETKKTEAEIPKIGAETTNIETDTKLKSQQTKLAEFNTKIAEMESKLSENGYSLKLGTLDQEFKKLVSETELTQAQTLTEGAKVVNLGVQNAYLKSGKNLNEQKVKESSAAIQQIYREGAQRWAEIEKDNVKIEAEIQNMMKDSGITGEALQELQTLILTILAVGNIKNGKGKPAGYKVYQ